MSCCGTRYRVNKLIIKSQHQQVPELPKVQTREDDIIHLPKDQRKLFKCTFNLTQVIKPEHMVVASVDYTNLKGSIKAVEVLGQLMREDIRSRESFEVREGVENQRVSEILESQRPSKLSEAQIISERQKIIQIKPQQERIRWHEGGIKEEQVELHIIDELSPKRKQHQPNRQQQQRVEMMIS